MEGIPQNHENHGYFFYFRVHFGITFAFAF